MSTIEVPINIGEKLYFITDYPAPHIVEATVYQITVKAVDRRCEKTELNIKIRWIQHDGSRAWEEHSVEYLKQYFFWTREEAERFFYKF